MIPGTPVRTGKNSVPCSGPGGSGGPASGGGGVGVEGGLPPARESVRAHLRSEGSLTPPGGGPETSGCRTAHEPTHSPLATAPYGRAGGVLLCRRGGRGLRGVRSCGGDGCPPPPHVHSFFLFLACEDLCVLNVQSSATSREVHTRHIRASHAPAPSASSGPFITSPCVCGGGGGSELRGVLAAPSRRPRHPSSCQPPGHTHPRLP